MQAIFLDAKIPPTNEIRKLHANCGYTARCLWVRITPFIPGPLSVLMPPVQLWVGVSRPTQWLEAGHYPTVYKDGTTMNHDFPRAKSSWPL